MVQDFDITPIPYGSATVLAVTGELDLHNHQRLREAVHELHLTGPVDIVIDLTGTTFIDSVALGTLIGARRRAYALRGSLAIVLGNRTVTRVFELTGLTKVFTTYETLAAWKTHRDARSR